MSKDQPIEDKPLLYLMSKYTGRELDSLKENQDAWLALNAKGYDVYSPICESHNIEEYRKSLRLYDKNEFEKPVFEDKYKEPDYVARDLRLIQRFMEGDSCMKLHNQMKLFPCELEKCKSHKCYDSGIVGVVCNSGLDSIKFYNNQPLPPEAYHQPFSKGVIQEYRFMKSKNILIITLETALTVPRKDWELHAL